MVPTFPETRPTLIERVAALDPESWKEFVSLYDPLLVAYIGACDRNYQLELTEDDREDAKQEVLIKLFHVLPTFKLRGRFRTWLWRVTHNTVIDWLRRHRRRSRQAEETQGGQRDHSAQATLHPPLVYLTPDLDEQRASDEHSPDQQLIENHLWHMRRHILEKVRVEMQSAHKWDCFEKHFLAGRPSALVAEELGLSVSAVNTNTSRVRARIRELCQYYDVEL
jgi:RNA polymerase sigma-70 factor (ECF subfamily)